MEIPIFFDLFDASDKPYWTSKAYIFKGHKPKSFTPVNFSISYFVDDILYMLTTLVYCHKHRTKNK